MKKLKLIAIICLVAGLITITLQNRAPVTTHFLLVTFRLPQIVLLGLTALAGFCLGLLVRLFDRPKK